MTLILVALVAIAIFLFRLIKADVPMADPSETQSQRQETADEIDETNNDKVMESPTDELIPSDKPQIIGPPISKNTGNVEGKLCYPSEFIPAMDIYVQNTLTQNFDHIATQENQSTYALEGLQPGNYIAYAYRQDSAELGGGYTYAVPCGLTVSCTNHELIKFEVTADETTSEVDICDWYGAEIPEKPN